MGHKLQARYINLEVRDEDQDQESLGSGILHVRTQDDELIPFDKDVLQATYVTVHDAGTVEMGGGIG